MRKTLIPWLLSSAMVLTPLAAARAETSVTCMYMLMRVYKAELDVCHVPLAPDRDARYQRMKTSLEGFIRAHAKNDPNKIITGIETDNIKRALAGLKSCQSDDFKFAQQAMDQITTPDHEKMIQGTLSIVRDPQSGDCSS
ncbi:MAG TPA: hypothetical protein VNH44_10780 [Micropepsaceae bacterium]|nr:hypothetical protein [Micropepsaceae bacterium]